MGKMKHYTPKEIAQVLRANASNTPVREIANELGRTTGGINMLLWHFETFKKGKWKNHMSNSWKKAFKQYLSADGKGAVEIRAQVHEVNNQDNLLDQLDLAFENVKQLTVKVIQSEVERRSKEANKEIQKELSDLREFREQARETNLAATLRRSFMEP